MIFCRLHYVILNCIVSPHFVTSIHLFFFQSVPQNLQVTEGILQTLKGLESRSKDLASKTLDLSTEFEELKEVSTGLQGEMSKVQVRCILSAYYHNDRCCGMALGTTVRTSQLFSCTLFKSTILSSFYIALPLSTKLRMYLFRILTLLCLFIHLSLRNNHWQT